MQLLVASLIHSLEAPDSQVLYQMYLVSRKHFGQGGVYISITNSMDHGNVTHSMGNIEILSSPQEMLFEMYVVSRKFFDQGDICICTLRTQYALECVINIYIYIYIYIYNMCIHVRIRVDLCVFVCERVGTYVHVYLRMFVL